MNKQFNLEDYKGKYAMHCDTEHKAKKFLGYLDNKGKRWVDDKSYVKDTYWKYCKENTVYIFNENQFTDVRHAIVKEYIILSFDNFNWTKDEKTENKPFDFKVGQDVWDMVHGWGTVHTINKEKRYGALVHFPNGVVGSYNLDGKNCTKNNRTLFFEEIPIPETALKPKRWRAENGEKYWFISINEVKEMVLYKSDNYNDFDNVRYKTKNYFKTEEEAEAKLQKILKTLKED